MSHADFLLLGGGLASATAAETLRLEGAEGSIVIVAGENELPYHRPPLSTRFLLSDPPPPTPLVLGPEYYVEQEITVLRGTRALAVDPQSQVVLTDRAGPIHYGKLLLATGARPVRLSVPGSGLAGIHYLHTLEDARAIRRAAESARHAVVVGGGFIGMELSAALVQRGLQVTILTRSRVLFSQVQDPTICELLHQMYARRDVEIVFDADIAGFRGQERAEAVVTRDGRVFRCDLVAIGIGVSPDVDFLQGSGIALDDGIKVDRYLQADQANIFAAGDVANFFDPVFNVQRRIEHWDNTYKQGRLAARNMLDLHLPYDEVSYFAGQFFDFSFQFIGMGDDTPEHAQIGSLQSQSGAVLYLRSDVPRALFTTGRPAKETRAIESLIRYRTHLGSVKARLSEPGFSLAQVPSQTVIILQGGGALGGFECGVARALEEEGIYPDIVAGVSIGAFNGAIIASNPGHAAEALAGFWNEISVYAPDFPDERMRRQYSAWQSLMAGVPGFFTPRWAIPQFDLEPPVFWTSFYDPSPAKELLSKYVDFNFLKSSPVRLLVSAVNVETAVLEVFDSYVDELTPDHILASGSLPPAFPWKTINGKHYWDGGILSNSPLELLIVRSGAAGKRIFIVDLFPNKKPLPTNLMEVMGRRDEIVYAERIRRDSSEQAMMSDFRKLVEGIVAHVPAQTAGLIREWPLYVQLMGDDTKLDITRITREATEGEPASKDYDFSRTSIEHHIQAGYDMAKRVLKGHRRTSCYHPVAPMASVAHAANPHSMNQP
jgi:NADPH-dependent 2,4-dienoyl-CoA reductase/sulfur reductase-like enzyme/predicted acylesterase/phospholipase RssA